MNRNLGLYLPRLPVLLSTEANRPRAWSPGPLGPYQALFTGIQLISEFKRVKAPGNPTKSPFGFVAVLGVKIKYKPFARLPADSRKMLAEWHVQTYHNATLLHWHWRLATPGALAAVIFRSENYPPILVFVR